MSILGSSAPDVQIVKVNFVIGKYLKDGKQYVSTIIKELVQTASIINPAYIHLIIYTEPYRLYEELSYLTILECIHHIDNQLHKYESIMIGTDPKRIKAKRDFIQIFMNVSARGHAPLNIEPSIGPQLLFIPTKKAPILPMDLFVRHKIRI